MRIPSSNVLRHRTTTSTIARKESTRANSYRLRLKRAWTLNLLKAFHSRPPVIGPRHHTTTCTALFPTASRSAIDMRRWFLISFCPRDLDLAAGAMSSMMEVTMTMSMVSPGGQDQVLTFAPAT